MKTNENHSLRLSKCVLVPYRPKHVLKYHEWMKSEELQELTASEPLTLEQEYEMQKSWSEDDKKCTFIILDGSKLASDFGNEVDTMVGDVNLFFNDVDCSTSAEIEIMVAEADTRGKGIGKEATLAMMQYGIATLGVTIFTAKIGYNNKLSLALFHRLHFKEVSRSEAFQEVTLELVVTESVKSFIGSSLQEYLVSAYSE
ncbi:alpha/beta-tubulin-N-acetyltransferase 9-like [Watersipora subatra]|uniref:alpha/beta-tubulin-N-acetyltransferase 9-like n=1 Tax=Watersipora subatra TaxID=2589382 RepID=UPI00355BAC87